MKAALQLLWVRVWNWLRGLWRREKPYRVMQIEELPDRVRPGCLYALGGPARPWSAALVCPCGCGELLHLSLLPEDCPTWSLSVDGRDLPTLYPSVWRKDGCRSHFFLRGGRVVWCGAVSPRAQR